VGWKERDARTAGLEWAASEKAVDDGRFGRPIPVWLCLYFFIFNQEHHTGQTKLYMVYVYRT
jgi:hypothetical protein